MNLVLDKYCTHGSERPKPRMVLSLLATSTTCPLLFVVFSTKAMMAPREASVICLKSSTSASMPLSLPLYTSSMFLPTVSASMLGSEIMPSSGRSRAAMFTNVATASMALGGSPIT
uniref:Uncharacterized protein n=1 Tax=Arundo donax TaxID=35708 RepID=A0A0A9NXC5_ARUDO